MAGSRNQHSEQHFMYLSFPHYLSRISLATPLHPCSSGHALPLRLHSHFLALWPHPFRAKDVAQIVTLPSMHHHVNNCLPLRTYWWSSYLEAPSKHNFYNTRLKRKPLCRLHFGIQVGSIPLLGAARGGRPLSAQGFPILQRKRIILFRGTCSTKSSLWPFSYLFFKYGLGSSFICGLTTSLDVLALDSTPLVLCVLSFSAQHSVCGCRLVFCLVVLVG